MRFEDNRALVSLAFGSHSESKLSLVSSLSTNCRCGKSTLSFYALMHWSTCHLSDETANRRGDTPEDISKTNMGMDKTETN